MRRPSANGARRMRRWGARIEQAYAKPADVVGAAARFVPTARRSVAAEARVHEGVEDRPEGVADARRDIHAIGGAQGALSGEDLAGREPACRQVELVVDLAGAGSELETESAGD